MTLTITHQHPQQQCTMSEIQALSCIECIRMSRDCLLWNPKCTLWHHPKQICYLHHIVPTLTELYWLPFQYFPLWIHLFFPRSRFTVCYLHNCSKTQKTQWRDANIPVLIHSHYPELTNPPWRRSWERELWCNFLHTAFLCITTVSVCLTKHLQTNPTQRVVMIVITLKIVGQQKSMKKWFY